MRVPIDVSIEDSQRGMSIISLLMLVVCVCADRVPNGGANCTKAFDCGEDGGLCIQVLERNVTLYQCSCYPTRGAPDCSYRRFNRDRMVGLQIGLSFITIDGIGNILMGNDRGTWQLCLGLSVWILLIPLCCCLCCGAACMGICKGIANNTSEEEDKEHYKGLGVSGLICWCCLSTILMVSGFAVSVADGVAMMDPDYHDPMGFKLAA
jgi:hypothetical protein